MKPHIKVIQRNGVDIFISTESCTRGEIKAIYNQGFIKRDGGRKGGSRDSWQMNRALITLSFGIGILCGFFGEGL